MQTLGTKEAADYLNLPESHIIRLIERGRLPFSEARGQRYIEVGDLDTYQNELKAVRKEALHFLVAQAQELDMGYSDS